MEEISALHPSNPPGLYVGGGGGLSQFYLHMSRIELK